jgi:hypothetical protein
MAVTPAPCRDLLTRLGAEELCETRESKGAVVDRDIPPNPSLRDRFNAAIGCRTSEVALSLLSQVVALELPNRVNASNSTLDTMLMEAAATVAELELSGASTSQRTRPRRFWRSR